MEKLSVKFMTKRAVETLLLFFFLLAASSLFIIARYSSLFFAFILCLSAVLTALSVTVGGAFAVIKTYIQKTE